MTPDRGLADGRFMEMALALARRGSGLTGGNPSVGCVLVKGGRVIGRGRTGRGGRPHAETGALVDAAMRFGEGAARGATAYVTLEPCAHHGKTPPCSDALVAAGVTRVVAPFADPDPRVSGKGFAMLEAAGVAVDVGERAEAARTVLAPYLRMRRTGRPTVTLKLAASLDGGIATASGESKWITGPAARARGHLLRARADAILTGIGTVLADDPALDVRLPGMGEASPVPVIADRALRTPPGARVLARLQARGNALVLGDRDAHLERAAALERAGATVLQVDEGADAGALLAALGEKGFASVFCEGGATLAAALLRADAVDRLVWFSAGLVLGADARGAVDALGIARLAGAPRFRRVALEAVGEDVMETWERPPDGASC